MKLDYINPRFTIALTGNLTFYCEVRKSKKLIELRILTNEVASESNTVSANTLAERGYFDDLYIKGDVWSNPEERETLMETIVHIIQRGKKELMKSDPELFV